MSHTTEAPRLKYLPVAFFAMVMGLAGLSIAWHKAASRLGLPGVIAEAILAFAALVFLTLLISYGIKSFRYPAAVANELAHPIQLNFFPAISISLILLATASLHISLGLAGVLWVLGTALHLVLTLYIMSVWIHHEHFQIQHVNPAWFLPVVGNVLVPIAGAPLGFVELSWFFFSVGILFWILLFAIILYRVFFHPPIDRRLMPTFFILLAPPAAGFISYLQLTGELDAFARVLYYGALFLTLLLATQIGRFLKLQFSLSWWAYSFPLAVMTTASLIMSELTGQMSFTLIGSALLGIVTLVVIHLLGQTARAVGSGRICVPVV
ncbi:MAG: SLAC1 anion channel family protein [Thiocapsa sp.]|nr:SLAC1 anion channel family protein [Thiocapsa sp.]MCG6898240.1 SLAC1 anion channel family protein [Thiocapsa sp.]MCG6984406.1 SLAC1 anion channel family protein [Thiocapsa sp.]